MGRLTCKTCKAVRWCVHAFGKHYNEKSRNGKGCDRPLTQDAREIRRHEAALPPPDPF